MRGIINYKLTIAVVAVILILAGLFAIFGVNNFPTAKLQETSCDNLIDPHKITASINSEITQTVPGTNQFFKVKIKNDNSNSIVGASLFVKIFKESNDDSFFIKPGYVYNDFLSVKENFVLKTGEEINTNFAWKVPNYLSSGMYIVSLYLSTNNIDQKLLLDQGTIASRPLIISDSLPNAVEYDLKNLKINGNTIDKNIITVSEDNIKVELPVKNTTDISQTVTLDSVYTSDLNDVATTKETVKTESVDITGKETKTITFNQSIGKGLNLLQVTLKDHDKKQIIQLPIVKNNSVIVTANYLTLSNPNIDKNQKNNAGLCFSISGSWDPKTEPAYNISLDLLNKNIFNQNKKIIQFTGDFKGSDSKKMALTSEFQSKKKISADKLLFGISAEKNGVVAEKSYFGSNTKKAFSKLLTDNWLEAVFAILSITALVIIGLVIYKELKRKNVKIKN